ncbi:hypothetical protein Tco_0617511, partial [Tanacetum coccineum]
DKFEEEEDPQEDEDDMEIDIKEDENEPKLTYPYEEVDPLNPPPPASESEPDNEIEKLLPGFMRWDIDSLFGRMVNVSRRLCGRETAHALVEKKGKAKDDKFYGKLILELGNEVHSSVEQGTTAMEKLVEKLGKRMPGMMLVKYIGPVMGQVTVAAICEVNFCWFMKCCNLLFSWCFEGRLSICEVGFEINLRVFSEISECAEGKKVKFAAATLEGPALTLWKTKVETIGLETVNQMPWTEMKQLMTAEFNELALMCPRMVEPERVKVDAYIRGLTDNIKGEVTSSKPADLSEAVRMAHKLME